MSNARDSEMRQKVQPPSHFSPRYRYRPPHHTTESERKRDTLVECTSERERKGKRQRRERKGSGNAGGGGKRAGGGGRHWRAWMEERDGQDKIEREPSVTDGDRVRRGWRRAAEPGRGGSEGKGEYDGGKGGGREEEGI